MTLRPLNDRVLVRPQVAPTVTDSGLHLSEHYKPEQVGTVIAVGRTRHPLKQKAEAIAAHVADQRAANLLRDLVRREPVVKAGDRVLFSWSAGQELRFDDGERYLVLREADLLAVVEE